MATQHICPSCQADITAEVKAFVVASPKVRKVQHAAAEEVGKLKKKIKQVRAARQSAEERIAALEERGTLHAKVAAGRRELATLEEAARNVPSAATPRSRVSSGRPTTPRVRVLNATQRRTLEVMSGSAPVHRARQQ